MPKYVSLWILGTCRFLSYMGHLKERTLKDQMAKDPTEVIRKAVLRMLPRNKLRAVSTTRGASLWSHSETQTASFVSLYAIVQLRQLLRVPWAQERDRKLRTFAGSEHPFGDRPIEQYEMPPRQVREMRPRARRALIRAQKKAEQQQQGGNDLKKGKRREQTAEVAAWRPGLSLHRPLLRIWWWNQVPSMTFISAPACDQIATFEVINCQDFLVCRLQEKVSFTQVSMYRHDEILVALVLHQIVLQINEKG